MTGTIATLRSPTPPTRPAIASLPRASNGEEAIPHLPGDGPWPLSFAQQRLWFLDQLTPGNPFYNADSAVRLNYPLNPDILGRALTEIIRRHESLRTRFIPGDDGPSQAVVPASELPFSVIDLRPLPPAERESEASRLATEEARTPFDLRSGALLRARLVSLADAEHVLLLTLHHVACDGWSLGILWRELSALYQAFSTGRPSPLPALPIQYRDFAVWQRRRLQGETLDRQLAYWREQLADLPLLQLPTDRPRPRLSTYRGAYHLFTLPPMLSAQVKALARREEVTLFMALLATFQTLLHRYAGQDEIVVGSPLAGRTRPELEDLIGFFINTVVLRSDLRGDPGFRTFLRGVRQTALEAYAHQDVPFEMLVQTLQPDRDLNRNPLFQVIFQHLDAADSNRRAGPGLTSLPIQRGTSKFDLLLDTWETAQGIGGQFVYDTDLFEAETIERFAAHFQQLLESIVTDPDRPLSRLNLLPPRERRRVLLEFNDTSRPYPRDACVHHLFEAQAARTPDGLALVDPRLRLTYSELNARANQLAAYLRECGVTPESRVGVCLERSADLVVALLAILKAGGAYVPLDPGYPAARLAYLVADAEVSLLLTRSTLQGALPETDARVICLDAEEVSTSIQRQSASNPPTQGGAGQLAYIIYTSGSTGNPKGACIPHRGVVRLVSNTNFITIQPEDVFLQFAPVSFDASTFEIWGPLLNGARLVVYPPATPSLEALAGTIHEHGVTILWLTAELFHNLVDHQAEALSGVHHLLAGGDVLSPDHVRRALAALPGHGELINGYGPTENTTFTCCHRLSGGLPVTTSIPIGKPVANTQVYVLDRHGQPVPIGVPGELYTGGDGLARGYLKRPDLTAERFVAHPFSPDPEARLYRTGDLVRWRPDGTLEFLGRLDHQIKIRGFRIEPGEVEAVLAQHPGVQGTAVIAREDSPGDRRLVAYLVSASTPPPGVEELRAFLHGRLPEFMIPARFVILDQFPLSPNGKLDRRRLPQPEVTRPDLERTFMPARTPVEEAMAHHFAKVLSLERVGIHDQFFTELGGHSLLATQIISRVRAEFGVELPLRQVFETPTVAGLAGAVESARQQTAPTVQAPSIPRLARDPQRIRPDSRASVPVVAAASHGASKPMPGDL